VLIAVITAGVLQETGFSFLQGLGKPRSHSPRETETQISLGAELVGRVTHIRDGDTIEVEGIPIRIANLDCAERGSDAGARATQRMRDLSALGPMICSLEGRRTYDREVGVCALVDGRDLGEILIAEGVCSRWHW